jgi:hypothetical protein
MKQVPYSGPTILEQTVNLTIFWHSLLSACELSHTTSQATQQDRRRSTI